MRLPVILDAPVVIEGLAPIWADLDGMREIIVTLSDDQQGAQIVAYDEQGRRIAAGSVNGRGGRWRHQLAVAWFGPGVGLALVGVRTPHIGGIVEFYVADGRISFGVGRTDGSLRLWMAESED